MVKVSLVDEISGESLAYLESLLSTQRVRPFEHVYVVGTFDQKKTIKTQQLRASAIATGLAIRFSDAPRRIAIVGGGFSGLTATSVLVAMGHTVTLFEEMPDFLPLQTKCRDRMLHPDLYDWPDVPIGANDSCTVGGLEWKANYADDVAKDVLEEFEKRMLLAGRRFDSKVSTKVLAVASEGSTRRYSVRDNRSYEHDGFDAVLTAVGYGRERQSLIGSRVNGYWENSQFEYSRGTNDNPFRVLISGNGDGGLVETLHASIAQFSQLMATDLVIEVFGDAFVSKVAELERTLSGWPASNDHRPRSILRLYDQCLGDQIAVNKHKLRRFVRTDTAVAFNSANEGMLVPGSSAINRVLVYALVRSGSIQHRLGYLTSDMIEEEVEDGVVLYKVKWRARQVEQYDRVVVRHGVNPSFFVESFPELEDGVQALREGYPEIRLIEAMPGDLYNILTNKQYFDI